MTKSEKLNSLKRDELFSQITEALSEISDLPRRVFVLAHYRGFPDSRIAAEVGVETWEIPLLRRYAEATICQRLSTPIPFRARTEPRRDRRVLSQANFCDQPDANADLKLQF